MPAQATRGKELAVAINSFGADSLDPIIPTSASMRGYLEPMFDSFIRVDTENRLIPGVFTSWKPSDDGLSWTFEMRKGVKFHDNQGEATAEDAKFALERYKSSDSLTKRSVDEMFSKVEVLDPYTVRIHTARPDVFLPLELSQHGTVPGYFLMPKKYIEERGVEQFRKRPVGSGPYQFKSHTPGSAIEFTAFDGHWEIKPGYDALKVLLVPQENARIGMLRQGQVQVIEVSPDGAQDVKAAGLDVRSIPASVQAAVTLYGSFYESSKGKPLADVRVRKALSRAINPQEMITALLPGAEFPWAAGVTGASQDADLKKWAAVGKEAYKYDPNEAKSLLSQAGYPTGFDLTLYTFPLSGAPLQTIGQAVAGYWEKIGVKTKLSPIEFTAYTAMRTDPPAAGLLAQATTYRSSDRPDLVFSLDMFYHSKKGTNRLLNSVPGTSAMPDVDQMLDSVRTQFDPTKRSQLYDQILTKTVDSYAVLPVAQIPVVFGVDPKVDLDVRPLATIGSRIIYAKPKR